MDIEEARAWVTSPATQRYLQAMDDDAEAAVDAQAANLRRMGSYPSGTQSAYRAVATTLDRAQGEFNTQINLITLGRARDGRAALAAYRAYVAALMALEAENGRLGAFIEADAAALAERLVAALNVFVRSRIDREAAGMLADLDRIRRDLERARRQLTEAQAQRIINGVLGGIGFIVSFLEPPVAAGRAIAAASFAVPLLLDAALGPSSPDTLGAANTSVSALSGVPRLVRPGVSRFTGVIGSLTSLVADCGEVELARTNLRDITQRLTAMERLFRAWTTRVTGAIGELSVARAMWDTAITRARRSAAAVRTSEADYRDLQRQIEALR